SSTASSSPHTTGNVFCRLFMVLKSDFLVKFSARVKSTAHPSHRFAASYSAVVPRGVISGRASLAKESIHAFDAKAFDAMCDDNGCGDFGPSGQAAGARRARRHDQDASKPREPVCDGARQEQKDRAQSQAGRL